MQVDASIKVSQSKYATDLLVQNSWMQAAKCPFISEVKLGDFGSSPLVDNSLYRQLVGSLLYITHSRPDLAYAVGVVARYM